MINLNYFLCVVSSLSFIAEFEINENDQQNYFIFDSNTTCAQLHRSKSTILLWLSSGTTFESYNFTIGNQNTFSFEWADTSFRVDGKPMIRAKSTGHV